MRSLLAVCVTSGLLVIAGCSSKDAADAEPASSELSIDQPATTPDIPPTTPDDAPATTVPQTTEQTEPSSTSYSDLREAAFEGDESALADLALAEFALLYGPVDGAADVRGDPETPTLGTATLTRIATVWDALTAEQQTQIADALAARQDAATLAYSSTGDVPTETSPTETSPTTEARGFMRPRSVDIAEVRHIAEEAAGFLQIHLGPQALDVELFVVPAFAAGSGSVEADTVTGIFAPGTLIGDLYEALADRDCVINIYDRARMSGDRLRSTVAHELFHCWAYTTSMTTADFGLLVPFFDEGMATWVGEQFAHGSSFGEEWFEVFSADEKFSLYASSYSAFGFWTQIASANGGPSRLWPSVPALRDAAALGADSAYATATTDLSLADWAVLASNGAREPGWSRAWDFDGEGITSASRPFVDQAVTDSAGAPEVVGSGEQQIVRYRIDPRTSEAPWIATLTASGLTNNRWEDGDDFSTTEAASSKWCVDGPCVCPDGSEPEPAATDVPTDSRTLYVAMTGPSRGTTTADLAITSLDELCEPEPDPVLDGETTGGLVGEWNAQAESVIAMFDNVLSNPEAGLQVATVVGRNVILTFAADGSGTLFYDDVTVLFGEGSPVQEITIDGGGSFSWDVNDSELRIQGGDFNIVASSPAFGSFPLDIGSDDIAGGGTSYFGYSIDGVVLTLASRGGSRGDVWFPTVWLRQ